MHNFHSIETEAEYRRLEWQREAAADILASQALATQRNGRLPRFPQLSFAGLRSLAAPHLSLRSSLAPSSKRVAAAQVGDC